jgi:hypothetical protein
VGPRRHASGVRLLLSFTDFPLREVTLYLEYGTLMPPQER